MPYASVRTPPLQNVSREIARQKGVRLNRRRPALHIAAGFGLSAIGLAINLGAVWLIGDPLLITSLVCVTLSSLRYGAAAATTTLAVCLFGQIALTFTPLFPWPLTPSHVAQLATFATASGLLSFVGFRFWRALFKARELGHVLRASNHELALSGYLDRQAIVDLQRERLVRERFVNMLSHDLRNPIAAVKMHLQMMRKPGTLPREQDKRAVNALRSLERANKMIEDLLDASRIESGQMPPLRLEHCDLRKLILDAVEDFSEDARARFRVEADSADGLWCPDAIRRVFENLVTNALKYGDKEKPIRIRVIREQHFASLTVQNFGVPLTQEDQKHLFEPFRRSADADASVIRGWGIGLTLVSGLVQAHRGKVMVHSNLSEGTEFTVTLPLVSGRLEP